MEPQTDHTVRKKRTSVPIDLGRVLYGAWAGRPLYDLMHRDANGSVNHAVLIGNEFKRLYGRKPVIENLNIERVLLKFFDGSSYVGHDVTPTTEDSDKGLNFDADGIAIEGAAVYGQYRFDIPTIEDGQVKKVHQVFAKVVFCFDKIWLANGAGWWTAVNVTGIEEMGGVTEDGLPPFQLEAQLEWDDVIPHDWLAPEEVVPPVAEPKEVSEEVVANAAEAVFTPSTPLSMTEEWRRLEDDIQRMPHTPLKDAPSKNPTNKFWAFFARLFGLRTTEQ